MNEQPELRDHRFLTRDRLELPVRIWLPDEEPKAVFLALHGFNDYSNAFVEPANFWRRQGIATFAYDQRGFGNTPNRGYWPGVAPLADDAADMLRILHRRYPGAPLYVLGDSMGAAVAAVMEANDRTLPVAGMILVAPAVWARDTMNPFQSGLLWFAAHSVPWMTVSGRGLDIMPSDNIAMLRALARDPLVIKDSRIDTLYGLADLMDAAMADADKLRAPLLVLYGDHDEVVPRDPVMEFLQRLTKSDAHARAAFYSTGYHMLLRDLSAETVMRDVASWISDANTPLPSGAEIRAMHALAAP
ncbi:MAG TPA: lysophospholipase [Alphaproteobacteria bacterium]|nr:lysophospholipase [Alphaproteobacteria bacterium]